MSINVGIPQQHLSLCRGDGHLYAFDGLIVFSMASQGPGQAPEEAECVCGGSPVAKSSPKHSQHSLNDSNGVLQTLDAPSAHSDDTESQDAQLPAHIARLTRKSVHLIEEVTNFAGAKGEGVQVVPPAARFGRLQLGRKAPAPAGMVPRSWISP